MFFFFFFGKQGGNHLHTGINTTAYSNPPFLIFNSSILKRYFSQIVHFNPCFYNYPANGPSCVILILLYYGFQCIFIVVLLSSAHPCRAAVAPDVFVSGFELCTTSYQYVSHSMDKHTVSHGFLFGFLAVCFFFFFLAIYAINYIHKYIRITFPNSNV